MQKITPASLPSRQTLLETRPSSSQADWRCLLGGEQERRRLAPKLHDGPIQTLIALSYHLAEHARRQATTGPVAPDEGDDEPDWPKPLAEIRREVLAVAEQLRRYTSRLDPAGLGQVDLQTALQRYLGRLEQDGVPPIELHGFEVSQTLPEAVAICLFRVSQEALHNIVHHAQAGRARLDLRLDPVQVLLDIRDDGRGLTLPLDLNQLRAKNRLGFVSMTEWIGWMGGRLTIESAPAQGTRLQISLPLALIDD